MADKISTRDIIWLAGLIEGEGSFLWHSTGAGNGSYHPVVTIGMTDKDIIERVSRIWELTSVRINRYQKRPQCKDMWRTTLTGSRAIGWMMMLYQFMGIRRKAKIREIIGNWKQIPGYPRMVFAKEAARRV